MLTYQKNNDIKGKCVTNTQYFYDNIKNNFPFVGCKAKAVIVVYYEEDKDACHFIAHMVFSCGNEYVFDPSYEVSRIQNAKYFDNIKSLLEYIKPPNEVLKYLIKVFLEFVDIANKINDGCFVITDKEYYNQQADFVENNLKTKTT